MELFNWLQQIDKELLLFLNSFHNSFWDMAITILTSKEIWIPFYLLIVYFIIKTYKTNSLYILLVILIAITVSDQFSVLVKNSVQRLRPTHDPLLSDIVHNIYNRGGLYGFFSSHAANSFTIAVIALKLFKNYKFSIVIIAWAILVSYTRIYLGLHYPGDIFAGILWGTFSGLIFYKLILYIQHKLFSTTLPEIKETGLTKSDALIVIAFVIIYTTTILVTINRLVKYQFFN